MESASRLRKLSRNEGRRRAATEAAAGDRESLESAVVQNSAEVEEGEEVVRPACGAPDEVFRSSHGGVTTSLPAPLQAYCAEVNLQGGIGHLQGLLKAYVVAPDQGAVRTNFEMPGITVKRCVSEDSIADESSGSEDSNRGGLDRSLHGRKSVFPRKVVLKKQSGHQNGDIERDADKKSPEEAPVANREVSKVGRRLNKRKHQEARPIHETDYHDHAFDIDKSASSSDSGSSSSESEQGKREVSNKKRRKAGEDMDGNITWTDESVRFLYETYNAIHRRLCEQNSGQVKYQKKWTSILKAMRDRFGQHFTKKQCQSKYWCVRRECSDYRYMSSKMARTDPFWNPSIAGRELLKPKFYDVWYDVSGRDQSLQSNSELSKAMRRKERLTSRPFKTSSLRCQGPVNTFAKHQAKDCNRDIREMQQLMQLQLQASEKREEGMKYRAELMMELLTQHMEHVEKRVSNLEESRQPQLYLLERINTKLERVLDGFSTLNKNLSIISSCIFENLES